MALIETRDLSRVYDLDAGRVVALDRVSLDIDDGEFVAVMGPSGSGKSTFMNLVGCLDRPSAGHYRLAGAAVESLNADGLARSAQPPHRLRLPAVQPPPPHGRARQRRAADDPTPGWTVKARARAGARRARGASAWPSAALTGRSSCPAASSSASPSPGRW
jgi:energy-coupling factor transporter ATP-binding protein EcfA2